MEVRLRRVSSLAFCSLIGSGSSRRHHISYGWCALCWLQISGADKFAKVIDFLGRQLHSDSLVIIFFLIKSIFLCVVLF